MELYTGKLEVAEGLRSKGVRTCTLRRDAAGSWVLHVASKGLSRGVTIDLATVHKQAIYRTRNRFELVVGGGRRAWTFTAQGKGALQGWLDALALAAPATATAEEAVVADAALPVIVEGAKERVIDELPPDDDDDDASAAPDPEWQMFLASLRRLSAVGAAGRWYLTTRTVVYGAFGKVRYCMPLDPGDDELLAIKEFRVDGESRGKVWDESRRRWRKTERTPYASLKAEIESLRRVQSPLQFRTVLKLGGKYYGVMPLMLCSFKDLLAKGLAAHDADELSRFGHMFLRDVAAGLRSVHDTRQVFNDLKPDNVLLGPAGPVLADYGICRPLGADDTCSDGSGSPGFFAPECYPLGSAYTTARDIFTLGMVWAQLFFPYDSHCECDSALWPSRAKDSENLDAFVALWNAVAAHGAARSASAASDAAPQSRAPRHLAQAFSALEGIDAAHAAAAAHLHGKLAELEARDAPLFDFVWRRMLCPDPAQRADAAEVEAHAAALLAGHEQEVREAFRDFVAQHTRVLRKHDTARRALGDLKAALVKGAPWDARYVQHNLQTLGQLQEGDQLLFVEAVRDEDWVRPSVAGLGQAGHVLRNRFGIARGGARLAGAAEPLGGDLLDDRQFALPMLQLLRAAVQMYRERHAEQVRKSQIADALQGLRRLGQGYAAQDGGARDPRAAKVAALVETAEVLLQADGGVAREAGVVDLGARRTVDLLSDPVTRTLRRALGDFLRAVAHERGSQEAPAAAAVAVHRRVGAGAAGAAVPPERLPSGERFSRRGLGICRDAQASWSRVQLALDGAELEAGTPARARALQQALGSDALLFLVSQLTSPNGLPAVIHAIFTHKHPKNMAQGTINPIFCAQGYRFYPSGGELRCEVLRQGPLTLITATRTVSGDDLVQCHDQRSRAFAERPTYLRELGIDELCTSLEVGVQRRGGKLELALRSARIDSRPIAGRLRSRPVDSQQRRPSLLLVGSARASS